MTPQTDSFEPERWSLFVQFDSLEEQLASDGWQPQGERLAFEEHVLADFGGLFEELPEIFRTHSDGRVEVTGDITFMADLLDWLTANTIPREVRLVRNQERRP